MNIIKNIYCFDDAIGIDADYQFSFNCNKITAELIRKKNNLKIDTITSDFAFGLQNDFLKLASDDELGRKLQDIELL